MVGDTVHDLEAARAAGALAVAVMSGPTPRERLEPHADVLLPSIAKLDDWLCSIASKELTFGLDGGRPTAKKSALRVS